MKDDDYMKLAIELAKATMGQTNPNPVVGAVVVNNGEVVGMGAHLRAGEAHAEVHALQMAGERAKGATIYVTLEPCSHYGKTPPCADLVVKKGIKRAVIASLDPNPLVSGKGIERMKAAGISVETGILKEEADALNKIFFHYIKTKIPYVTLKTASSLDGKTATVTGDSKWITGEQARLDVHQLRHQHDAILVGVQTVIADNPSLTTRLPGGGKHPIRIVLDASLRIPEECTLLNDGEAPTWIITGNNIDPEKAGRLRNSFVEIFPLPTEKIDIKEALTFLGEKGVTSLLVEGGSTVHGSFLKAGRFNQMISYVAPKLIGGKEAPTLFGGEGIPNINEAVQLKIQSVEYVGDDLKLTAVPLEGERNVYGNY
ncbi:bifunctional diaminohydroxyphosphoribosylaminopyrimidine deaminase/5-amino-6-(5-phosphoribosylamino)uracil reductase RibD [Bacillus songklensis]|uniref:Riboflavin biosynthesis protein RibD n=1 Tax=Bacillus songklensis TaxID=1069116 RepID=A0ABV8B557_9BACI